MLGAAALAGPAAAEDIGSCLDVADVDQAPDGTSDWGHLELWIRPPNRGGNPLGHVRLVVGDTWYERTTKPAVEPDMRGLAERTREYLFVVTADLTIPGRLRQGSAAPDTGQEPGRQTWPYQRVCLPATPQQVQALRTALEAAIPRGVPEVVDDDFHYLRNNCSTWPAQMIGAALRAAPSERPGEASLARRLLRRQTSPVQLQRSLVVWGRQWGAEAALRTSTRPR